jgi:hypothetical protein
MTHVNWNAKQIRKDVILGLSVCTGCPAANHSNLKERKT